MIRKPISLRKRIILGVLSVLIVCGGYGFLSYRQHAKNPDDKTIPNLSQLADGWSKITELSKRTEERWIVVDSLATGKRFFLGWGLGVLLGVSLGLLMGCFKSFNAFLLPPLSLASKAVPTAMMAVFFVVVGSDLKMYVTMIIFGITPTIAVSIALAIRDVPDELVHSAYAVGASHDEAAWNVIFKVTLPKILAAVRLAIGPSLIFLVPAEMIVGEEGYGFRIRLQSRLLNMNAVYIYIMMLLMFGYFMDLGMKGISAWLCPWYKEGR